MSRNDEFLKRKQRTDVAQVFLCYMSLVGDGPRTAAALDLDPDFVQWLAEQEGWVEKVKRISLMSRSEKPGDFERATNRALNFCQAHRIRLLIDKLLLELSKDTPEKLMARISVVDKKGDAHPSARFFADLLAAAEKAQTLSYYALGDSAGERRDRAETDGTEVSAAQIHAALLAALNSPAVSQTPTHLLVAEQTQAVLAESTERKSTKEVDNQTSAEV